MKRAGAPYRLCEIETGRRDPLKRWCTLVQDLDTEKTLGKHFIDRFSIWEIGSVVDQRDQSSGDCS